MYLQATAVLISIITTVLLGSIEYGLLWRQGVSGSLLVRTVGEPLPVALWLCLAQLCGKCF